MGAYSRGGGLYEGEDPVYFKRNFFMSIKLIVTKSMNFCGNSIKCLGNLKWLNHQIEASNSIFYVSSGGLFEGEGLIDNL